MSSAIGHFVNRFGETSQSAEPTTYEHITNWNLCKTDLIFVHKTRREVGEMARPQYIDWGSYQKTAIG